MLVVRVKNLRIEIWAKKEEDSGGGDCWWSVGGVRVQDKDSRSQQIFKLGEIREISLILSILTDFERV
jgi:hypothetical protein